FFGKEGVEGTAALQRLDAKLFDTNLVGISAFAFRSEVDPYYESFASTKSKDEFSTANRSSNAVGMKFRLGSVSIMTTNINAHGLDSAAGPTEAIQKQTIGLDLKDLATRIGVSFP